VAASFLEIVELEGGEIVLQRADDEGEPLVSITFSEETKAFIDDARLEVAKIMIQAGIQAAAHISGAETGDDSVSAEDGASSISRIVH